MATDQPVQAVGGNGQDAPRDLTPEEMEDFAEALADVEKKLAPWAGATLHNLSPVAVRVDGALGVSIDLPPLGQYPMDSAPGLFDMDKLANNAYVELEPARDGSPDLLVGLAVVAFILGAIFLPSVTDGSLPVFGWFALCVGVPMIVRRFHWAKKRGGRPLRQILALAIVIVIGFALPALVVFFGTDLFNELRSDPGNALDPGTNRVVAFRCVQAIFIGLAATFPVLLYFVFDRQTMGTLRTQFLLALFRLDPTIHTAADWRARYGHQVEGAFGPIGRRRDAGLLRIRNSPVVMATITLAVGWALAFLNAGTITVATINTQDASPLDLLVPERTVIAYGFLGAYFFTVQSVLRSYMRGDLRPKSYSAVTARILVVVAVCALVSVSDFRDDTGILAIAFFAGVMPEAVLQWIWETVQQTVTGWTHDKNKTFVERRPLTDLDGIDIYDRSRLAEEGVTNVEALAHGDLVDLMLQTRIPAGRLVDWVDQAALHVQFDDPAVLKTFRRNGIRTATDLLTIYDKDKATLEKALASVTVPNRVSQDTTSQDTTDKDTTDKDTTSQDTTSQDTTDKDTTSQDTTDKDTTSQDATGEDASRIGPARLTVITSALLDAEWISELLSWRRTEDSRPRMAMVPIEAPQPVEAQIDKLLPFEAKVTGTAAVHSDGEGGEKTLDVRDGSEPKVTVGTDADG